LTVAIVAAFAWWAPWRELTDAINVPPGYEAHRGSHYRLAFPAGWRTQRGHDGQGTDYEEFNGPATADGAYSGHARVGYREGWPHQLEGRLLQFRNAARQSGYRILKEEPVVVEGAVRAHRFEVVQEQRTPTGASTRSHGTDIFALTDDQVLLQLTVRAADDGGQLQRLPEIVGSFRAQEERRGLGDLLDSFRSALPGLPGSSSS
jgi:hypothetical protein